MQAALKPCLSGSRDLKIGFLAPVIVLATLGLAYSRTLAPGVTWANDGADSGDLVTAAATLGVAHPTGYPSYLLLVRLFQYIPLGDLAFRANLFSMVAALLAALCVYTIVRRLASSQGWPTIIAAGAAALALGLSPAFWSQAVVAEVHSLNALFVALIFLFTLQVVQGSAPTAGWPARSQAIVAGLALGNHVTIALPIAAWLAAVGVYAAVGERLRALGQRLAWMGAGLLVYLYLPLRAAAHAPASWGEPVDWAGFWWVVSGQPYHDLAFGLPPVFLAGRVAAWAALLAQQFGWPGLILGFVGLVYGARGARGFMWLTAGVAAIYSVFAITYNTADSYAYLIPVYLIFAIWIGAGAAEIFAALARWNRYAAPLAATLLVAALALPAPATARQVDASHDRRAIAYAAGVLAAAAPGALVITSSDRDTFPIWYYHYTLGERPDIAVIVAPLLEFDWYRAHLRALYPSLAIPERSDAGWADAIAAAHRASGPVCRTRLDTSPPLECDTP